MSNVAENDYLFDLNGYRVIRGALSPDQVTRINAWVDHQTREPLTPGQWLGNVEVHSYQGHDGINFQNVVEAGDVFEECIDHPSWIDDVRRYVCTDAHGLSINECFLNVRETGGFIGIHAGGHVAGFPHVVRHHTGKWIVGQVNILMALTDVGPGDGATTVVPGSHKSHEIHPSLRAVGDRAGKSEGYNDDIVAGEQLGMVEVHLRAGDALMFTDALCHGSTARTNPGQRRVMIYRYSPHVMKPRYNYIPSQALLDRLTPERRKILSPMLPRLAPGQVIRGAETTG
jgi:hypothetical protein